MFLASWLPYGVLCVFARGIIISRQAAKSAKRFFTTESTESTEIVLCVLCVLCGECFSTFASFASLREAFEPHLIDRINS
jgi:hypothetical protein